VEQLTPTAVIDLYIRLSDEDKSAFRRLFGQHLVAEELFLVMDALPLPEQARFTSTLDQKFIEIVMPDLILAAIRLARTNPQLKEAELVKMVEKHVAGYYHTITEQTKAETKKARDPKKRNIERDTAIIRLAREGKTSGEIRRAIKSRWNCTPGAVNQVIIRAKRDGLLPK
jgi:hypothetical protein